LEVENKMRKRIKDCSDHNSLTVGGSSFASYLLLTEICKSIFEKHPQISVTLDIGNIGSSLSLVEKIERNELDILVTYGNNHPNIIAEPICEERLIIAMHKKMPGAEKLRRFAITRDEILENRYSINREIEDMSIFGSIEFLEFPIKSDTHQRMSKILGNYIPSRYKIENSRHSEMHYNLMCAGIGAVLTTSLAIAQKPCDENILFFVPKCEESHRKIYLAHNSSSKNNALIKEFIQVAKDIYAKK
jgi:DNA-binding transcriptional LysR family regulator